MTNNADVNIGPSNEHQSVDVFTSLEQYGINSRTKEKKTTIESTTFHQHSHFSMTAIQFRKEKHDGYNSKPVNNDLEVGNLQVNNHSAISINSQAFFPN
jgi:hypothetical protein